MLTLSKTLYPIYDLAVRHYGAWQKNILKTHALAPFRTFIFLTYKCNCVCYFCCANFPSKEDITLDDLKNILKQLPKGSLLSFSGGEATLLDDFLPMMKLATKHHRVHVYTSGSTLNKNKGMIKELVNYGIGAINFSIDVPNVIHDNIRGPSGLLMNVTEAIKEIKELRRKKGLIKPLIHINSVIIKESIPYLPEMVEFSIKLGVDTMSFGGLGVDNYDENDLNCFKKNLPIALELAKRSKFSLRLGADVETAYQALKDHSGSLKEGIPKGKIDMSRFKCYAPWSFLLIEPDGKAHICRDGMGISNTCTNSLRKHNSSLGTLGNVKNTPIKVLWNNKIAQEWRKSIMEIKELPQSCLSCCLISRS